MLTLEVRLPPLMLLPVDLSKKKNSELSPGFMHF